MIVDALRDFLADCPYFDELAELNVDFLPSGTLTISLEPTPSEIVTQRYVDDSSDRQFQFVLATRFDWSEESALTISNSAFFEHVQEWMEQKTDADDLPYLGEGKKAFSIEALSSGYLYGADPSERSARYQIQCVLRYTQEV